MKIFRNSLTEIIKFQSYDKIILIYMIFNMPYKRNNSTTYFSYDK